MIKLKIMSKLSIRLRQPADPQGKPLLMTIGQSPSSGQALLIILLIMAVALTIGLAIISRSVTDVRISQQTEEAARAYSAAEAGIESALVGGSLSESFTETGASYQASRTGFPPPETTEFVYPQELNQNEIQTVYLATYDPDPALSPPFKAPYYSASSIFVCWQNSQAALEITFYYKMVNTYKVSRYTADPDADRGNNFSSPDVGSCAGLDYKKEISLTDPNGAVIPYFLRIRTLYADTKLGIAVPPAAPPGTAIPEQGTKIDSLGQAGTASRKVEVIRFHPAPPEIFDFTLYSGGDLVK